MTHKRGRSVVSDAVPRAVPDVGGPVRVTYRGGAAFGWVLVDCLEREGGVVEWDPPEMGREGWSDVAEIEAQMVVLAAVGLPLAEAVSAGVARFRRRFPDRGTVKIESDDAD
jgi:hypothetical protein